MIFKTNKNHKNISSSVANHVYSEVIKRNERVYYATAYVLLLMQQDFPWLILKVYLSKSCAFRSNLCPVF